MKEMVGGIEVAIERLLPGSDSRRKWINNPRAQRLPMKFVFTVKPNDNDPLNLFIGLSQGCVHKVPCSFETLHHTEHHRTSSQHITKAEIVLLHLRPAELMLTDLYTS